MQRAVGDATWRSDYEFSFLPDSFLCRLMCRLFAWKGVTVLEAWKYGAVIEKSGHRCYFSRSQAPSGRNRHNVMIAQVVGPFPQNLATLVSTKMQDLRLEAFPGVQVMTASAHAALCLCLGSQLYDGNDNALHVSLRLPGILYEKNSTVCQWLHVARALFVCVEPSRN